MSLLSYYRSLNPLTTTILFFIISTFYFIYIKQTTYNGIQLSESNNLLNKIINVHSPTTNDLPENDKFDLSLSNELQPFTLLKIFNITTLGYLSFLFEGYFSSIFIPILLFLFVPFEYFLLYDLIVTNAIYNFSFFNYLLFILLCLHVTHSVFKNVKKLSSTSKKKAPKKNVNLYYKILIAFAELMVMCAEYWWTNGEESLFSLTKMIETFKRMSSLFMDPLANGMNGMGAGISEGNDGNNNPFGAFFREISQQQLGMMNMNGMNGNLNDLFMNQMGASEGYAEEQSESEGGMRRRRRRNYPIIEEINDEEEEEDAQSDISVE
ncbi:hypothetical protein ABK040_013960 [Willaertia magna]